MMVQVHVVETRQALLEALACLGDQTSADNHDPNMIRAQYQARRAYLLLTGSHPTQIVGRDPAEPRPPRPYTIPSKES